MSAAQRYEDRVLVRTTRHADATAADTKLSRAPTLGTFDLLVQQLPVGGIPTPGGSTISTCQWRPQPSSDGKKMSLNIADVPWGQNPHPALHRRAAGTGDDQVYSLRAAGPSRCHYCHHGIHWWPACSEQQSEGDGPTQPSLGSWVLQADQEGRRVPVPRLGPWPGTRPFPLVASPAEFRPERTHL